jgi:hypothetical protein
LPKCCAVVCVIHIMSNITWHQSFMGISDSIIVLCCPLSNLHMLCAVCRASMGGMVAQELALLLLPQHRLLSLSLSITCRGMQPMHGLLSPILTPTVRQTCCCCCCWLLGCLLHTMLPGSLVIGLTGNSPGNAQKSVQTWSIAEASQCLPGAHPTSQGHTHWLLAPHFWACCVTVQVIKNFFELWFWDSKPKLVRRLMRLLLTRQLMESLHPAGETYGNVGGSVGVHAGVPARQASRASMTLVCVPRLGQFLQCIRAPCGVAKLLASCILMLPYAYWQTRNLAWCALHKDGLQPGRNNSKHYLAPSLLCKSFW